MHTEPSDEIEQLGYLGRLMVRLTIGAAQLPNDLQERHATYILNAQRPDGGWAGREGESDIYYSSFALRSLAILGLLDGDIARRSADFLVSKLHTHQGLVDLLSLVYSVKLIEASCGLDAMAEQSADRITKLNELLSQLRRQDGGYSKTLEGGVGSTYQTFLVLLCQEILEVPFADPDATHRFLMGQHRPDGGFLEIHVGKRSGTNPSAAALGALRILGKLDRVTSEAAIDFLLDLQTDEGGFQANTRIPFADGLSTFTGLLTGQDLGRRDIIKPDRIRNWLESQIELPTGGFRGASWDQQADVEYSFYGLGILGLLYAET